MPSPYVGAGFSDFIGTRTKPGQTAVEFYNTQNPQQLAFGNPGELANFAKTISGRSDINEQNVFDVVKQGFTPRATALEQITAQLNDQQNKTFSEQSAPKRQSSSLAENIATENNTINEALNEFNTLKSKLTSLQAPNYQQSYTDLRTEAGLPQLETDFAANQKTIRELPYVNRQNFGNAGVATEGQLAADTAQKGIPLEIQQANLLDRLKLAEGFVNNSLKFKEMDASTARESLQEALNLVADTINLSRTRIEDLTAREQEQTQREQVAQQFAFENRITKPFYDIGGTVYRTSDRLPAHNRAEYVTMGGVGDFSDVQKISPQVQPEEVSAGASLIDPTTGKLIATAPSKATGGSSGGSSGGRTSSRTTGVQPRGAAAIPPSKNDSKPVTAGDNSKYGIPTYVTQGEANKIRNGIRAVVQEVGTITDQNRWDLWGQVADAIKELGLNPDDYDGLLWEAFHPEGLQGFYQYSPNSPKKKETPKKSGGSLLDRIDAIPD
jgi:hypothetical protein